MKLSGRGKRSPELVLENQNQFLQQLQSSLVNNIFTTDIGIDQFEKLYQKKKMLSETIDQYRQKNKFYLDDIQRAKQRIYQIAHLNDKANKQSVLMRNQLNKINEAHMVSKILMMEKIVRMGLQQQNLQKKRTLCNQIKQQKQRLSNANQSLFEKKRRSRELSLLDSKTLKSQIQEINSQTIQQKRSRAERIRSQKQRRRQKLLRYEKFKIEQAKKNYLEKTQNLVKNLNQKQKLLETLYHQEEREKRHFETTQIVTKEYLENMLHGAENSTIENSSLFPTQAM